MRIYFSLLAESITHLLLCVTRKESREHNKPPRMSQIAIERLGSEAGGCCCFCILESQIARRPELSAPFFSGGRKANGIVFHCDIKVEKLKGMLQSCFLRPPEMGQQGARLFHPTSQLFSLYFSPWCPVAFQPALSLCGKRPCSPAVPKALSASSQKRLCSSRGDLPPWKGPPLASTS